MSDKPMADKPDGKGQERKRPVPIIRMSAGAIIGVPAFALIGSLVGCLWLWPDSNLCGLFPFLLAIPLGAPLGACIGALTMVIPQRRR
jgi:hypothetical protein